MTEPGALEISIRLPLDRFRLDFEHTVRGRATGIFGPSGAGKSSLLKAIAGLERAAVGRIRMANRLWLDSERGIYVPPEARGVGYVPQEGLLFPHLDVRGNLLAGAHRARGDGRAPEETLAAVCDLLELGALLRRKPDSLSGGERQRVALGRALCSGPGLLLLDEPLASLDLPLRRRVLPFLQRVRRELDVPMILVSHDPTEVQSLCDELVVLKDGAIVTHGPTRRVLTEPKVFELEGDDGFQNLLPCRVREIRNEITVVELGHEDGGVQLTTPGRTDGTAPPGARTFVAIPAHEIIVSLGQPGGISALNVLAARITEIEAVGGNRLVTARLSSAASRSPEPPPPITSQVTAHACEALGLAPELPVFLIIKTAACVLLGGDRV